MFVHLTIPKHKDMKTMKVIERSTGNIYHAQYAPNSGGNMRLWVEGKFYSDKKFAELFEVVKD